MTTATKAQRTPDVTGRFVDAAFQVKAERDALVARVAELEGVLGAICAKDHCYAGADADTGSATSLYTLIKNARAALKGQA